VAPPNVFAMKNSGLEPFLYAEVGTELNGSTLTVLSLLARLGEDPWGEAARWAGLPKGVIIDTLAQNIAQMPLGVHAIADARVTAARLILLLPAQNGPSLFNKSAATAPAAMPPWLPMALLCCFLALTVGVGMALAPKQSAAVPSPAVQATHQAQ